MDQVIEIQNCLLCRSKDIAIILDFGQSPLANSLLTAEDLGKPEFTAPLRLVQCSACGAVQLKDIVSRELLFKHYDYATNNNSFWADHFYNYAKHVSEKLQLDKSSKIIDIGGNSGEELLAFQKLGYLDVYNIEPAENISQISQEAGVPTVNRFFDLTCAMDMAEKLGGAMLITSNNVFGHLADYNTFALGIKWLLHPRGTWIFEVNYWRDVIKGKYFDVCYHEHSLQHLVKPLKTFLAGYEMEIFDIEQNNNQGGTIRVFVKNKDYGRSISPIVDQLIKEEEAAGLYQAETYSNFYYDLTCIRNDLTSILTKIKEKGQTIACAGVPAKFCTFSHFMGLDNLLISFACEDSPLKQNKFTSGNRIPIYSFDALYEERADYCLVTAWNFAERIIQRHQKYIANGGKFIIPLPNVFIN